MRLKFSMRLNQFIAITMTTANGEHDETACLCPRANTTAYLSARKYDSLFV